MSFWRGGPGPARTLFGAAIFLMVGLSSCASRPIVSSETTIEGELRRIKGGFAVGERAFACDERDTLDRIDGFMGTHVKMTGAIVKHAVECPAPQLQCRTGEWYYTVQSLSSIEPAPAHPSD